MFYPTSTKPTIRNEERREINYEYTLKCLRTLLLHPRIQNIYQSNIGNFIYDPFSDVLGFSKRVQLFPLLWMEGKTNWCFLRWQMILKGPGMKSIRYWAIQP
jgi:hypothetical protein